MSTRILVPSGVLGLGFDSDALAAGLKRNPHAICIDGGSTDSGPFYLGSGSSKYAYDICRSEWAELMAARAVLDIPLIIGSCGTCGTDNMVDWMYEMTIAIAREKRQTLKIARIYCERPVAEIAEALDKGRIGTLDPAPEINSQTLEGMSHIVSLAGVEPVFAALSSGADIILAGRMTDTAVIAAVPLMRGEAPGPCWHGAKIAECGAFCTTHPETGVILLEIDDTGFVVEPMAAQAQCTARSVSAHMLYENADPLILHEPGGFLDVRGAVYENLDERRVRAYGAVWTPVLPYMVKLEGARQAGFQTIMLAIIRDPDYVRAAEQWADKLRARADEKIAQTMAAQAGNYDLDIRLIGINAALGAAETQKSHPVEVGVLVTVTAVTQEQATEIARLINPYLLHLPLGDRDDMPTFAFPHSPAHSERGPVFEFALNHLLHLNTPTDGFTVKLDEVSYEQT